MNFLQRIFLIIVFVFNYVIGHCQEKGLEIQTIDKNLKTLFPIDGQEIDTLSSLLRRGTYEKYYYQIVIPKQFLDIGNLRQYKIALNGAVDGYKSSEKFTDYTTTITDTAIGGTFGRLVTFIGKYEKLNYQKIFSYLCIAGNQLYIIQLQSNELNEAKENKMLGQYFGSLVFDPSSVPEYVKDEELINKSYSFGKSLRIPTLLLISILIVTYFVKRRK